MQALPRIAVLISGRGSNLDALIQAERTGHLGGTIVAVISNRADAGGLAIAAAHGVASEVIEHRHIDPITFETRIKAALDRADCDLVVLAGFMRILSPGFVAGYAGRLVNIHPSLLPAFGGLATHRRALAHGVRIHGCTVHFVTADLDAGPIIAQGALAVMPEDDEQSLARRVLEIEHRLLPAVVRAFCRGQIKIAGNRVRVQSESPVAGRLQVPAFAPM